MGFLADGKKTEESFAEIFDNVDFSSAKEDINEHWDLKVSFKIDVKGLKKRRRGDDGADETIHWVEIKNVNGKKGWLYGDADYFAFELEKYWVIVNKLTLQDYIAKNTVKEYSIVPIVNRLYKRDGRKDVLTLVSSIDLIYMSTQFIKK
jgi:hypothetical protein